MRKRIFSAITISLMVLALLSPICHSATEGEESKGAPQGWSDEVNISKDIMGDGYCNIGSCDDNIIIVWEHTYVSSADWEIVYSKSSDSGYSWSSFKNVSNSNWRVTCPDVGIDQENVHVVWEDREGADRIDYRNSTDGGESWNPIRRISSYTGAVVAGPQIYVNNSNIHIIWGDYRDGPNGEIYYRRSIDGGITWDNGQGVDEDRRITFSPSYTGAARICGYESNISIIWSDETDGDWDIYWMTSKDNGNTWEDGLGTPNIGRKISDDTSDSVNGGVAINGSHIHIIWYDELWPGPEYRIYYRNSTDNCLTWNPTQLLTGPSPLIASPDITTLGDNVTIVWDDARDDGSTMEIYYKNSTDGGISWSDDLRLSYNEGNQSYHPRLALDENSIHVSWWDNRGGNREIFYKRYPDFPPDPTYNITLDEGWNLISLPHEQRNESITEVLSSINSKWDYLQAYDPLAPEPWKTYATFKPSQLNELQSLNHRMGFWINITEPGGTTLTVSGPIPTSTSINLYAGWNLIGYASLVNETVGNALWGTGADKVLVCDTSEPYHIKELDPTYVMKPGEGYWVHVMADSVWTIDW